ncbi:hypothetical protein BGZ59_008900 [Podila verticillata]|nr:hypothetical protein BGZ59_008900 [Podila verticillata]
MSATKPTRQFVPLLGEEYAAAVPPYIKMSPDPYGGPKTNYTPEELEAFSKPGVLISGGGIGDTALALLLLKANIPFLILESVKEIKQLGIWDEFVQRSKYSAKRIDSFHNSEWGPEAAEALAREVRNFKEHGGKDRKELTLAEYVDRTPKHLISKVALEEIVFDTWYGGRTVLLGDVEEDIEKVIQEYRTERYPVAKAAYENSLLFTRNQGKNLLAVFFRGLMKRLPGWLWKRIVFKMCSNRAQVSFLPLIEDNAPVKPSYQRSLHRTLAIHKELAETPIVLLTGNIASVTV